MPLKRLQFLVVNNIKLHLTAVNFEKEKKENAPYYCYAHNTPCLSHKILYKHCLDFLLELL